MSADALYDRWRANAYPREYTPENHHLAVERANEINANGGIAWIDSANPTANGVSRYRVRCFFRDDLKRALGIA